MLYQESILEHYRNPLHKGTLTAPDFAAEDSNPLCGDELRVEGRVRDGRLAELRFSGKGCAISQAAADLLIEAVTGKPAEEAAAMTKEQMLGLIGIPLSAVRLKCGLLGLKVFKLGLYKHLGRQGEEE
jgi:nitrogen fixation NifU-like protein